MGLKILSEHLNGIILFEPTVFGDDRGFFMETWRADEFEGLGLPTIFLQDNHSRSKFGVLRGMHFQWAAPMGKLIRVTSGSAYIVEVDIRQKSPALGKWFGTELNSENKRILWVPPGFANGFETLSDYCEMQYKCTATWNKNGESGILWNDPQIGIEWKLSEHTLSDKDSTAQTLNDWLKKEESHKLIFNSLDTKKP